MFSINKNIIKIIYVFLIAAILIFSINSKSTKTTTSDNSFFYDLIIISPEEFHSSLQKLVDHKNNINMMTKLVSVNSIYTIFEGRDQAEQIKYFIKYALEKWNISYVLLVGNIHKIPIRKSYSSIWPEYEPDVISDHYYADIYDENGSFCSWDDNENNKFGEIVIKNNSGYNYTSKCVDCWNKVLNVTDIDGVDLYPDVAVGRLPCNNIREVYIMVNKIIEYERNTNDWSWFNKIIVAGGDTDPDFEGIEGEINSDEVVEMLPDFEHIKLYASNNTFNALKLNKAINNGAGFVSYSGHGFENGLGTFPKDDDQKMIKYYSPYIKFLKNKNRLPIIFLDACLTSKIDYTLRDLLGYKPFNYLKLIEFLPKKMLEKDLNCFAYKLLKHKYGGAIATLGATRVAYGYIQNNSSFSGYDYLNLKFFESYRENITLGDMFIESQKKYINEVLRDFLTIEEYILLGDPSLKIKRNC